MVAQVQALAPGLGVGAHDRLVHRRFVEALRLGHQINTVAPGAGKVEVVQRTHRGNARFPGRAQALVSAVHVAKMGLTTHSGHQHAINDRRLAGHPRPGAVGVPSQRALVRVLAVGLACLIKVRQPVQLRVAVSVVLRHHMHLQLAKAASQGHLRCGRQVLRREPQHLVAQKGLKNRRELGVRHAVHQLDTVNTSAKSGCQGFKCQHGDVLRRRAQGGQM